MYEHIEYKVNAPVATITLNRPDRLNAWTGRMSYEVKHALDQAEKNKDVVGIIITGAGRAFCAGADMADLQTLTGDVEGDVHKVEIDPEIKNVSPGDADFPEGFRRGFAYISSIKKPVIAAVNGPCAGMAFSISLFCDFRFMGESGLFMSAFSQRGLIAEFGASWMLNRLVGLDRALDILYSSRKISAAESVEMGLATRVYKDEELIPQCEAYIQHLADKCAPLSIQLMKRQAFADLHRSLDEGLNDADELMAMTHKWDEIKEGVRAFTQKRAPNFTRIGEG